MLLGAGRYGYPCPGQEGGFEALEVSAYSLWSLESQTYLRNCCRTGLGAPFFLEQQV